MTVSELIEQLRRFPQDAEVEACLSGGLSGKAILAIWVECRLYYNDDDDSDLYWK